MMAPCRAILREVLHSIKVSEFLELQRCSVYISYIYQQICIILRLLINDCGIKQQHFHFFAYNLISLTLEHYCASLLTLIFVHVGWGGGVLMGGVVISSATWGKCGELLL